MRLPIKIDAFECDLATSYEELTTGEFFALRKSEEKNIPSMLSALSGIPEVVWDSVSAESTGKLFNPDKKGWYPLKYLYAPMDWDKMPIPKDIEINGKKIPVGKFLPTLKQKHLMDQAIDRHTKLKDPIDSAIEILAIHFQPIVTGEKFTIEDAIKFQESIKKTKITEAFPLATFFLAKLLGLENVMQNTWLTKAMRTKLLLESESSNGSESLTLSMRLQEETSSNTRKFGTYLTNLFSRNSIKAKSNQISESV